MPKFLNANEAKELTNQALANYNLIPVKEEIMSKIINKAKKGGNKIKYPFNEYIPENGKSAICDWLTELGYYACIPVGTKDSLLVGWKD